MQPPRTRNSSTKSASIPAAQRTPPVMQLTLQVRQHVTRAVTRALAAGRPAAQVDPSAIGTANQAGAVAQATSSSCCHFAQEASPTVDDHAVQTAPAGVKHAVQSTRGTPRVNKGLASTAFTKVDVSVPTQGKRSSVSRKRIAESVNEIHKSPSKKIHTSHSKDLCDVPKRDSSTVKFAKNNNKKLTALSSEQQQQPRITYNIKVPGKNSAVRMQWIGESAKDHDNKLTPLSSEQQLPCITDHINVTGKRSSVSTKQTAKSTTKLQKSTSKKSQSGRTKNLCSAPKLHASTVSCAKHHGNKSTPSSSEQQCPHPFITDHIKGPVIDIFNDPPLELLGERCQLCRIELAFRPAGESAASYSNDPPVHAVLACGHAFHSSCLENILGPMKPSQTPLCFICSNSEARNQ